MHYIRPLLSQLMPYDRVTSRLGRYDNSALVLAVIFIFEAVSVSTFGPSQCKRFRSISNTSSSVFKGSITCRDAYTAYRPTICSRYLYKGWRRITEQTHIADRQRSLSTSGKSTHISWFISFPTSARRVNWPNDGRDIGMCAKSLLGSLTESNHTIHMHFKPSSCVQILRIDSHGMCMASARAQIVRCQTSSITVGMVLMLVTITTVRSAPPCSSNSTDSRLFIKTLCHCWIVESCNVSFSNASFNNTVVSLSIFFKRTQNLIIQRRSADTSIFSKYSATHCVAIHECSALYTRFFFFMLSAVNICSYVLVR